MAYCLIRARGVVNVNGRIQDTLRFLHLPRVNFAAIVPSNDPSFMGMIKRAKDYVAYGEIDAQTLTALLTERGRLVGDKPLTDDFVKNATDGKYAGIEAFAKAVVANEARVTDLGEAFKPFFRMHPPIGGWEPIKRHYTVGGALGYRGREINKLVKKMTTQPEQGTTVAKGA